MLSFLSWNSILLKSFSRPWQDLNLQSPVSETDALSIRPQGRYYHPPNLGFDQILTLQLWSSSDKFEFFDRRVFTKTFVSSSAIFSTGSAGSSPSILMWRSRLSMSIAWTSFHSTPGSLYWSFLDVISMVDKFRRCESHSLGSFAPGRKDPGFVL